MRVLLALSFEQIVHFLKQIQGGLKLTTYDEIYNIHAQKIQGRHFSEVAEAPQAFTTSR